MKAIRSIHVGVGYRGRWPINLMPQEEWEPVAIVDPDPELAAEAEALLGLPPELSFRDLESCLSSVEADAVIICAPTAFHEPLSNLAFKAGLAVLVEKGMTFDLQSAVSMVRNAEDHGVPFCVVQNHRYMQAPHTLQRELEAGTFGKVAYAEMVHNRYRPEPRTLTYPYAMVWDMGVHHFDTLIALFGEPSLVQAQTFSAPWSRYPYDAGISAMLEFESGTFVSYMLSHVAHQNEFRFQLHTEAGTVNAPYDVGEITLKRAGSEASETFEGDEEMPSADQIVLDTFAAYLRTGREPGISGRYNLQTMALCQAVSDSARTGRPVEVRELLARAMQTVAAR